MLTNTEDKRPGIELIDRGNEEESGVNLKWKDLTYTVQDKFSDDKEKDKVILNRVRGSVSSGELVGILGPSGSGKTSLLNCLSQRNREGVTGDILLNEQPLPKFFSRNMGYVSQDDLFFPSLTVHETLFYSAQLKLKGSRKTIREAVSRVLQELDLTLVESSLIGVIGKGISGGERRRLAIGNEIIDKPVILLLDEPTSGLDSASALMVVELLKKMATLRNVAVLCTIHQPRVSVIKLFDSISLMGAGKVLYFGETVPTCLNYFEEAGYKCPAFENPADWMLDLVNTTETDMSFSPDDNEKKFGGGTIDLDNDIDESSLDERSAIVNQLAEKFIQSHNFERCLGPYVEGGRGLSDVVGGYHTSFFNQVWVLTRRNFMFKLREPVAVGTQIFNDTIMPLVIGGIYFNLGFVQTSISDRLSYISLAVLMQAFAAFDCILLFPTERKVYIREQKAGLYRTSAYILSKFVSEHPVHGLIACLGAPIYYYMAGLNPEGEKFLIFMLLLALVTILGGASMSALGALAKTMEQANLLVTVLLILFMLLDGTWVSLERIPDSVRWLADFSFMGLGAQAAIKNEFSGLVFECDEENDAVCFHTGEEVLQFYGFQDVDIWRNVGYLLIQLGVWKIITYFAVRFLYTGSSFKERLNT